MLYKTLSAHALFQAWERLSVSLSEPARLQKKVVLIFHTLGGAQCTMGAPQPVSLVGCDSAAPTLEFHPICAEMETLCSLEGRVRSLRTSKVI
jgi:hypothetical protein